MRGKREKETILIVEEDPTTTTGEIPFQPRNLYQSRVKKRKCFLVKYRNRLRDPVSSNKKEKI